MFVFAWQLGYSLWLLKALGHEAPCSSLMAHYSCWRNQSCWDSDETSCLMVHILDSETCFRFSASCSKYILRGFSSFGRVRLQCTVGHRIWVLRPKNETLHQLKCSSLSKIINFCNVQLGGSSSSRLLFGQWEITGISWICMCLLGGGWKEGFFIICFFDFGSCYGNYSWCQLQPRRPPNLIINIEAVIDFIAVVQTKIAIKKNPSKSLASGFCCNFGLFHKSNCVGFFLSMLFRHNSASLHAFKRSI